MRAVSWLVNEAPDLPLSPGDRRIHDETWRLGAHAGSCTFFPAQWTGTAAAARRQLIERYGWRRLRPVIISELSDVLLASLGGSVRQTLELLDAAGYRVIDCATGAHVTDKGFHGNVLAVPR